MEEQANVKRREEIDGIEESLKERKRRSRAEDLRRKESRSSVYMKKRNMGDMTGLEPTKRKSKRMRYEVLENWGMGEEEGEQKPERAKTTGSERKTTQGGEYVDDEVRNHQELLGGDTGIRKMSPGATGDSSTIPQAGEIPPLIPHWQEEHGKLPQSWNTFLR